MSSIKINAGNVRRIDMFAVDPEKIIVKEELRGRHTPPTEQAIIEMAESLLEHGQEQPVRVRKVENDKLQLISGFTRVAASRLIRSGFTDTQGQEQHDPDFQIRVTIKNCNDEESFLHNVVENAHRNNTSDTDDAHNQERLRERYGKTDADIARLYRCAPGRVAQLKKLLGTPDEIQSQVHIGSMPLTAALALMDLPETERTSALTEATRPNGQVVAAKVRKHVRDHHLADTDDAGPAQADESNGKPDRKPSVTRTAKEIREFFEGLDGDDAIKDFAKIAVAFCAGKRSANSLTKAIDELRTKKKR